MTSPDSRRANAMALAAAHGWRPLVLQGPEFDIQAFVPPTLSDVRTLTVYIEGDGLAWVDRHTPSFAPTPADPVALRLAVAHVAGHAVYLARPCQFTRGAAFKRCHPRYWGSHRFAPDVIRAMDHAVQQIQTSTGATRINLVGYSGGAAVAGLLTARRSDVVAWVTVAGTLDTAAWTRLMRLSPLDGSLNPADKVAHLKSVPQWHFAGSRDVVMPPSLLKGFLRTQAEAAGNAGPFPQVRVIEGFDHSCCWASAWSVLSRTFAQPDTAP